MNGVDVPIVMHADTATKRESALNSREAEGQTPLRSFANFERFDFIMITN